MNPDETCPYYLDCECTEPKDCTFYPAEDENVPDGRNGGPVNRFGCSYVDCDCTSPCTDKSSDLECCNETTKEPAIGTVSGLTIVISGVVNGNINING